jgi:hypothetical protein
MYGYADCAVVNARRDAVARFVVLAALIVVAEIAQHSH